MSVAAFSFSAATSLHRPETVLRAFYHAEVLSAVFYYIVIVVVPPALRERGLIFLGLYLPWRYVRDWEWEGADGLTLTIIRRRTPATLWLYWYPRVSLHIPYDKKGEVEQLLRERVTVSPASPRGGIGGLPHGAE